MNKLQSKNILITGGLGMIGSNLAIGLVKLGANVSILDASLKPYGANFFNVEPIAKQIELIHGDIRDLALISHSVQDKDIIYNLAGQISHNDSLKDPFLDASINYIGHLNVADAVKKFNPDAKIIYSGSRLQFGKIKNTPTDESHPQRPETPYALHKFAAESMYKYYWDINNVKSVCFRIANPYGVRGQMIHSKYTIINWFIRQAMEGKTITIFGDGSQIRDYIYINDLVSVLIKAGSAESIRHEIYNIGSGVGVSFVEMVNKVIEIVGSGRIAHVEWPENYINVETGDYITDIKKVSEQMNWKPETSIEDGIYKTWQYYKQNQIHYW